MASVKTDTALVLVDFINEMMDQKGKLSGKGYVDFDSRHFVLDRVSKLLEYARNNDIAVIHVGLGFSPDYKEQPENSPLFGGAKKFEAVKLTEWGTDFHPKVVPNENEARIVKHRVSAFFGTPLDLILRTYGVKNLVIVGCATDMAVQTAVRDAHDRDYNCIVISDCCVAANDEDHEQTIRMIEKVSKVTTLDAFTS